jgi:hypothetical protein
VINFRYHVVSITSVFLALAIGLVLGTAALNGPVANDLNSRVTDLRSANNQLRGQVSNLDKQVQGRDTFVKQVAPTLLANQLAGKKVLLVTLPGASQANQQGVQSMLQLAGASVTGTLGFTEDFVDPTRSDDSLDLATRLTPPGVAALPTNNDGVETAGALFGRLFAVGKANVTDAARTTLVSGFSQLKFVQASSQVGPADAVVLIAGTPLTGRDAARRNSNVQMLVSQLTASFDRSVLAAPTASGNGNVVSAVRGDDALATRVSTVDTAGSAEGQLAAALATAERFGGKAGHYGAGDGATAPVPALPKTAAK